MSRILNELLTRLYSDEGARLGPIGDIWSVLAQDYRDWLLRWN